MSLEEIQKRKDIKLGNLKLFYCQMEGKCPIHSDKKLEAICNKCQLVICSFCLLSEHKDHDCKPLDEQIIKEEIGKMNNQTAKFGELKAKFEATKVDSNQFTIKAKQSFEDQSKLIDDMFDELIEETVKQLNESRQRCKKVLQQTQTQSMNEIENLLIEIERSKQLSIHLESLANKLNSKSLNELNGSHVSAANSICNASLNLISTGNRLVTQQKALIEKKVEKQFQSNKQTND